MTTPEPGATRLDSLHSLTGLVSVVTGAASGIGAACAALLADRGADVMTADIGWSEGRSRLRIDVSSDPDCRRMVRTTLDRFGRLDIAVNAAGIAGPKADAGRYSTRAFDTVIAVNLRGTFLCLRSELAAMTRAGNGGAIVNISSVFGTVGAPGKIAYVASKHAVEGMTRSAALDYLGSGIRVNCVAPGFTDTPLISPESRLMYASTGNSSGRLGTAAEVAEIAVFLSSPAASNCTGSIYACNNGQDIG